MTAETNSAAALERFLKSPSSFDLLITDQTMPGMTGLELASRCLAVRPQFPILLCTGYSAAVDDQKIADMGIQRLLQKPVQIQEPLEQVRIPDRKRATTRLRNACHPGTLPAPQAGDRYHAHC